ncbi:MAG: beta strand repeat-containing protein, partial [Bacteroidota bacterium]
MGNATGATTVASGAVLSLANGITIDDNLTLAGTGISNGGVLINVSGNNTVNGTVTYTTACRLACTAGTLTLGNVSATDFALTLIGAGSIVVNGVINIGNANITLSTSGGSSLTLNNANTINNGFVLTSATRLNIGHPGALGTAAITLLGTIDNTSGAPLTLTTNNAFTISTGFTFAGSNNLNMGNGAVTLSASSTITCNGSASVLTFGGTATNTIAGNITITVNGVGNTLNLNNINISNSSTSRTLTVAGTGIVNITGVIANGSTSVAGAVSKSGTGILELRGVNTYIGNLTVNGGTVRAFTANAYGNSSAFSTITINAGGALEVYSHSFFSTKTFIINGDGVSSTGALRIMTGNCSIQGVNMASDSRIQVEAGATYTAAASIFGNFTPTLHVDGTMDMALLFISNGGNPVIKTGTGTLIFRSANNTHSNITVSDGRFEMEIANTLLTTSGITVNSPGIVDMNGLNQSVRFIAGNGTITNEGSVATSTLTLNNTAGETNDFSGSLLLGTATRINLTKAGLGTQILSGNNTYNGLTTISGGILQVASNNALGTANLNPGTSISSGATLALSGGISVSDTIGFAGSGFNSLGAIRNLSGTNTIVPPLTLTSSTNRINSDTNSTLIFAATATFNAPTRSITFGGSGNIEHLGTINITTGALTKDGTGMLTLGGTNSYTGGTTISAGTIRLGAATGLSPLSALTIGATSTLDVNGFNTNIGALAASVATASITSSSSGDVLLTTGALNTSTSYAGSINTGSATTLSLRKIGTGTLSLSGSSSTYNGTTVISAGGLTINTTVTASGNSPIGTNTSGIILGDTGTTAINASPTLTMASITYARNVTVANQPTTGIYNIINTGNPTISGQLILNQPLTLSSITGRTLTITGGITSANAGEKVVTFDAIGSGSFTVSTGLITDGAGKLNIQKNGSGQLTLSSALHTYSGYVSINAGTLRADNVANAGVASSLGTGSPIDTIYLAGGATFTLGATAADTTNRILKINGDGATVSTGSSNVSYRLNGNIVGNFNTVFSYNTSTIIVGGTVSVGNITKAGTGVLRLDNTANDYTGSTTVNAGTLRLGAAGVIPNGSAVINNSIFELNGFNETIGSLAGSATAIVRNTNATSATLTCGRDNSNTNFAGFIQNGTGAGTFSLVKEGTGILTLSNVNTYT